jgi:hypothetical protein
MTGDEREHKAIERFVSIYKCSFQKLSPSDVDYKILSNGEPIAYVKVVQRYKNISQAYPLPIDGKSLIKLVDKRLNPIIIWSCDDGIIYTKVANKKGEVFFKDEVMVYYDKQDGFKYIRYTDFS